MREAKLQPNFKKYATITIVFSMLLFLICDLMKVDISNVLVTILVDQEGWNRSTIMNASSIGSYIAVAIGFIGGTIAMRTGLKRVSLIGLAIMAVGTLMMSLCTGLVGMCFAFAICEMAYPLVVLSATTYITKWFVKRRGMVLGLVTMALPITSAIYMPVGNIVIPVHGKTIFYMIVFIIIACVIVYEAVLMHETPEECNCSPDGLPMTIEEKQRMEQLDKSHERMKIKEIFATKEGWFLIVGNTLVRFAVICTMSVMLMRMIDVGIDRVTGAGYLSIATIVAIPVSFLWGLLDDKIRTNRAITIFSITFIVGFILLLVLNVDRKVILFFACLFVASITGGTENLKQSIVGYVYGRRHFVEATRFLQIFENIGAAFAYTFMATMYSIFGTYNQAYIILIVLSCIMTLMYAMIRKSYDPERVDKPEAV